MNLQNIGYDNNFTYFEHNLKPDVVPTVFIHGVGLDNTMWMPQKKYFKNKSILFYDLLNHGKSKKGFKVLKFQNFNYQLIKLLDFLDIRKINLVGFSIGALIAQHFTSNYYSMINKLIIIASIHERNKDQLSIIKKRYNNVLKGKSISDESINRWFNFKYLKKNPKVYKFFRGILEKNNNTDFLNAYKLFVESDNYNLDYSNFKMPSLIMTGKNDIGSTIQMSKKINNKIKNSTLYAIQNAKHMATFEQADKVNKKILKFIS